MFVSIVNVSSVHVPISSFSTYEIDDDELGKHLVQENSGLQRMAAAVIKFYSERNLDVSTNLFLFFTRTSSSWKSKAAWIENCKYHLKAIEPYTHELEKLLLLE